MTDEDAAEVDQHSQLLVSDLERDERVAGEEGIEVSSCDEVASAVPPCTDERDAIPRMPENSVR